MIQIKVTSEQLGLRHKSLLCNQCDHDLADMTLDQGHDKPFGHGQQEIAKGGMASLCSRNIEKTNT